MGQTHGGAEGLLYIGIQIHACDLFHDEAQDHVVGVGIEGLRSRLVFQRGPVDHGKGRFSCLLIGSVPGKKRVVPEILFGRIFLIQLGAGILGISGQAALVAEQVTDGQLPFPALYRFQIRQLFLRNDISVCILPGDQHGL